MALNPDFIGRMYPASEPYLVGREKIREFATALGDRNPVYFDVDAANGFGYADLIAPPTFVISLTLKASSSVVHDPELGLDYSRVVHAEQQFSYTRPIMAGDELVVRTSIDNVRTVAGNDMLTTKAIIATVAGEQVATATSVLVSRGADA